MSTDDHRPADGAVDCWQRLDADDRRLVARIAPDLAASLDAATR